MGYVSPYENKKTNSTKQKLQSGTILKVGNANFTKEELEDLWGTHNSTLKELQIPSGTYTRNTSDLIKRLRDVSENLILSGAITQVTEQCDVASYVWKKLKEYAITYDKPTFYRYFSPEQKREWQTEEPKKYNSKHVHDWLDIEKTSLGLMKKCRGSSDSLCGAMMLDGKLFEYTPEDVPDPGIPKITKLPAIHDNITPSIEALHRVANNIDDMAVRLRSHSHLLSDKQVKEIEKSVFLMAKSGEILLKTALNKKEIIDPFTLHLLVLAYAESTQKVAAGIFIMNRLDLIGRRNSQGVEFFTKMGEFAKLISGKQTKKAMEAKIKDLTDRYEPTNEKDAMDCGFSGQQCENCHYFRIGYQTVNNKNYNKDKDPVHEKSSNVLKCYNCDHIPKRKLYKLPKERPLVQVEWTSN